MLFPSQGSIPDRRIKLLLRMLKLQDLYTYQTIDSGPRVRTNVWVYGGRLWQVAEHPLGPFVHEKDPTRTAHAQCSATRAVIYHRRGSVVLVN